MSARGAARPAAVAESGSPGRSTVTVVHEFWACVGDGHNSDRGLPEVPVTPLPADLVHLLMARVGLSEGDVAVMTKTEAVERIHRYRVEDR